MRLLHISDWHLGRQTYRVSRAPDHDAVLAQTLACARERQPDLILHSGDVWDALRPGYDDLARGVDALRELAEVAPVLVLCGNHDSPALFRIFSRLHAQDGRLRFVADATPLPIAYPCRDGDLVRVAALPFVHQNRAISHFETDPSQWAGRYMDRIRDVWRLLDAALQRGHDATRNVSVVACHLHLLSAVFSRSERPLTVSDAYAAAAEHLPITSYAAFGHIHRPQALPGGGGRYAGSPIPLDFGEEDEPKSIVHVAARPGRRAEVEVIPLRSGRPLVSLDAELSELAAQGERVRGSLCRVLARSDEPVPDLSDQVRALLPGAVILEVEGRPRSGRLEAVRGGGPGAESGQQPLDELFCDYLASEGVRGSSADRVLGRFRSLLTAAQTESEPELPELAALRAAGDDVAIVEADPPAATVLS